MTVPDEPLTAELVLLYAWPILDDRLPVRDLLATLRKRVDQLVADEPALAIDDPELTVVDRQQLPPHLAAARPDVPDDWDLAVIARVRAVRLPAPTDPQHRRAYLIRLAVRHLTDELSWPASRIGAALGIGASYVNRVRGELRRHELVDRAEQRDAAVQRLTQQGWTDQRIAEHLGLGVRYVGKIRRRFRLPPAPQPRSAAAQFHRDAVQSLAGQGWTGAAIAREIGLSRQYVSQLLAELRDAPTEQPGNDTPTGDHQVVTGGKDG